MKHTLFIILLITILKPNANSQSIDNIVNKRISDSVQALSNSLDSVKEVDRLGIATFNIDTIYLKVGQFRNFSISLTAVSGNVRSATVMFASIANNNGSYVIVAASNQLKLGATIVTPALLNNNTLCVIQVKTGIFNPLINYRRTLQ